MQDNIKTFLRGLTTAFMMVICIASLIGKGLSLLLSSISTYPTRDLFGESVSQGKLADSQEAVDER